MYGISELKGTLKVVHKCEICFKKGFPVDGHLVKKSLSLMIKI
jgi:hypothetical protein